MARVLVAHNSVTVRKVVELCLGTKGIEVLSVGSGSEAIERIERDEPDLVMCGVKMPGRDGFEICDYVRNHPRLGKTPVLLVYGLLDRRVLERAALARPDDMIRQPFRGDELLGKVMAMLPPGTLGNGAIEYMQAQFAEDARLSVGRPHVAKILCQVVGTIAGLSGIALLFANAVLIPAIVMSDRPWKIPFLEFLLPLLSLFIVPYLVWVGWVTWFRFSPSAVRHGCGFLGFLLLVALTLLFLQLFGPRDAAASPWFGLAAFGSLLFVCWAYRAASGYLIRLLFPEQLGKQA